jgi:hypothetical protein
MEEGEVHAAILPDSRKLECLKKAKFLILHSPISDSAYVVVDPNL